MSVIQSPEPAEGGGLLLRTTLLHTSGQFVSSAVPLAYNPASMQSLGSAITYARRYALAALVGVVTEADDDGNAADSGAATPAYRPTNGHAQPSGPPRKNGLEVPPWGRFGAPRQGKQLFMWAKDHGIVNEVQAVGKEFGFGERMTLWDEASLDAVVQHLDALRSEETPLLVVAE